MIDFGPYTKLYKDFLREQARLEEKTIKVKKVAKGESATERYMVLRQAIMQQITELEKLLTKMDKDQSKHEKDWGYPGSAGHIFHLLNNILEFMG